MAVTTNTQSQAMGISNLATGKVVTDGGAAAALTLSIGFVPRFFQWVNATSTAAFTRDTVHDGMAAGAAIHEAAVATTPAADQTTISAAGPVINTDGTVTVPATLAVASSTFYWIAVG